jgi:hypothetical protein
MAITVEPGDTFRITAKDVTHIDTGPVTTGLTGTATIKSAAGTTVDGPDNLVNSGDDWYADFPAPATVGTYTIVVTMTVGGATRTLRGQLIVQETAT